MRIWRRLNNLRWYARCPAKLAIFAIGLALVLYPKPWLIPTTIERYADMNAVLDPQHPGLAPLEEEVASKLPAEATARMALGVVEYVVCEHVSYAHDWEVWGVVEYLPTVDEALTSGREDCDGRAVVAASLLRRMGYDAWLVSDLLHVWVDTPQGSTMSPTSDEGAFVGREGGSELKVSSKLIHNVSRGLAYGVAAFPCLRELIIVALICVLAIQPRSSVKRRVAGCVLLLAALFTLRYAGENAAIFGGVRDVAITVAGAAATLAGWLTLVLRAAAAPRHSDTEPARSPAASEPRPD